MKNLFLVSLVGISALMGCARKLAAPVQAAEAVNPGAVEAILIAKDARDSELCASELRARGATVLYQGETGLLLTNRKAETLGLSACQASVSPNSQLLLDSSIKSRGLGAGAQTDIATLLRLIPAEKIGARTFIKNNPSYDGRGVTVAILDTGVELDHPMLKKTSNGEDKIVAFYDFSGQGRVEMKDAVLAGETVADAAGVSYKVGVLGATELKLGTFLGSTMVYSEDIAAVDEFKDVAVLAFKAADGSWHGKIDTNADKDFTDEAELYDFGKSRAFTKLGKKKSLTASLNLENDGSVASLVFDDGGHGTHVAGISTGFDPNGLTGVAPGAKVIGAKIGDNRLAGGSTTTASMLLAIDFAAARGAQVVNLSYGIRAGSNVGKSAIDQYIDKVAREKGILFSISAGNEGPGLLTIGTPAGAELAISNAAYLTKESAESNYGYVGIKKDSLWYFSSVGPLFDGGFKPTLLAPGTALSSVPGWHDDLATFSGTSMASPQVTGGLALLLSAAQQAALPADRATVTRAVYAGATHIPDLALIEQGHGLMNVVASLESLKDLKGASTIDYSISVTSPTAPGGRGKGIYIRARKLPVNEFTVGITPNFKAGATQADKNALKTYQLKASASWILTPPDFHLLGANRSFRAEIDASILSKPGLHSEKITAFEGGTGRMAFVIPVTVVVPVALDDSNQHEHNADLKVEVGTVQRVFVDVPAGTTAVQFDLTSDGQSVWAQLLDSEGRLLSKLQDADRNNPQAPLLGQTETLRAGVYEIDVVAPPFLHHAVGVKVRLKAYSLRISKGAPVGNNYFEVSVDNNFDAIKVQPKMEVGSVAKTSVVAVKGSSIDLPFTISPDDGDKFSSIQFRVQTAKSYYDLMTDYPYLLLDPEKNLLSSGGLELDSKIALNDVDKQPEGDSNLRIAGAFTEAKVNDWFFSLTEERVLKSALPVGSVALQLLEVGQQMVFAVNMGKVKEVAPGYENCVSVKLSAVGRLVQKKSFCP